MTQWTPCRVDPTAEWVELGHPVVDGYLELVRARCRPNTLLATACDLKVFFIVVAKDPLEVVTADVLSFVTRQRSPRSAKVVRLADGGSGVALSTIKRRLSSVSGFYAYLVARGDVAANPVLRGLATRASIRRQRRGMPLVRPVRVLPRVLKPRRGQRAGGGAAQMAGPGDGRSDDARRATPSRGARVAAGGSAHR